MKLGIARSSSPDLDAECICGRLVRACICDKLHDAREDPPTLRELVDDCLDEEPETKEG